MRLIVYDVWANALRGDERSQEFFKKTREPAFRKLARERPETFPNLKDLGKDPEEMKLEDVLEMSGGEEQLLGELRQGFMRLRERMRKEDGSGERECF